MGCAWQFFGLRGYEINKWHRDEGGHSYFAFGFNLYTELVALVYVSVHPVFSAQDILLIRRLRAEMHRCDVLCVLSRSTLPPASVLSHLSGAAIERIEIATLKKWLVASHEANGGHPVNLFSEYLDTLMQIGTKGLERIETSTILLPEHFGVASFLELMQQLGVSADAHDSFQRVQFLPLEIIRLVAQRPELMRGLSPRQFEQFVAEILYRLGFSAIELTPTSKDGGKDILARKLVHDIPINFIFECKRYSEGNKVGLHTLRSLLGVVANRGSQTNVGVLVTTSTFTKGGIELIATESRLDGKDFADIQRWLKEISDSGRDLTR